MWEKIVSLFILAQQEDEPSDFRKLLWPIVIFVLYVLSGLFKGKQGKKSPPSSQPKKPVPKSPPRPAKLPTYTRKLPADHPSRQVPPVPSSRPAPRHPSPVPRPVSHSPKPRPPVQKPRPVAVPRPAMQRPTKPAPRPKVKIAQVKEPSIPELVPDRPVGKKAEVVQPEKKAAVASRSSFAFVSEQPNELVRAILYGEILGKPVSMRSSGHREY